jgi:hypothetical protein
VIAGALPTGRAAWLGPHDPRLCDAFALDSDSISNKKNTAAAAGFNRKARAPQGDKKQQVRSRA